MVERRDIRVSDRERQLAADRLKAAMDEGRLDLFEYDSRLAQAYRSATYAELDQLFHDLPPTVHQAEHAVVAARRPARRPAPASPGLPLALKILWTVWGSVVLINLVVWTLVSLTDGDKGAQSFWPMWLLIPGTALFGATLGVQYIRRNRAAG